MFRKANLVAFTRAKERVPRAVAELKRVGVQDVQVWWNYPNPFDKVLLDSMPHTRQMDGNAGFFNCSRTHYRIVKTALELGEDGVFVCEDDCRFMKDAAAVEDALENAPEYDVLLLDAIPARKGRDTPVPVGDGRWSKFRSMRSAACYALSRKAMERIVWLYESAVDPRVPGRFARICDQWFEKSRLPGLDLFMATPNLAVQQTAPDRRNSGNKWRLRGYETLGVDLGLYAEY